MSVATFDLSSSIQTGFENVASQITPNYAASLRQNTTAVRLSFTWFGARKAITGAAKENIADSFSADSDSISASKKLFANHKAIKNLSAIKTKIRQYWLDHTLPFPEDGVRLIRRDNVQDFRYNIECMIGDLNSAVDYLDSCMPEIKQLAREKLGDLYHESDYPESFKGKFGVELSFPNVEIPSYLADLDPEAFEAEKARVTAQFEQAVRDAENEFIQQFEGLLSHLVERLETGEDGKPKTFKEATVNNLRDFFERFKSLNIGNNDKLNTLVSEAQDIVSGINAKTLRVDGSFRESVKNKLSEVSGKLDAMMINRPRRKLHIDAAAPIAPETASEPVAEPATDAA